jgi:replicative DNA helicase
VFTAISEQAADKSTFDVITVADWLSEAGKLSAVGGIQFLIDLQDTTPSSANLNSYASTVAKKSTERQLLEAGQDIAELSMSKGGIDDRIEQAQSIVMGIGGDKGEELEQVNNVMREVIEDMDRRFNSDSSLVGKSTGYNELDEKTQGLQGPDLIILAARPSMGKTTLAMNIAESMVRRKEPVLAFSMEMSKKQLMQRMTASAGGIELKRVLNAKLMQEDDWPKLNIAASRLKDCPLFIDDRAALNINQMRRTARKMHRKTPLSLIIVDYLQLGTAKGDSRVLEVSAISAGLKALAKELSVPVLCLSQLSRNCESRQDKRPMSSDLRDSGAIEQDADQIWMLYRDEVYNEDSERRGIAELIITKNRNGELGMVPLASRLNVGRFDEYTHQVPEQTKPQERERGFF